MSVSCRISRLWLPGALVAVLLTLTPGAAEAQVQSQGLQGSFRLNLDADLLRWDNHTETRIRDGLVTEDSSTTFALAQGSTYVLFGYMITDAIFLGGRLGIQSVSYEPGDFSTFSWSLAPVFEFLFLDGAARPFVFASAGIGGESQSITSGGVTATTSMNTFGFAGGGGLHYFLTDSFSIDPRLELGWTFYGDDNNDYTDFRFAALVGLSGFF
ncbi:MAG: porin family protein [Myxococcales bacterium]|nr:porin family protein [Myxococcales bacterium]